MIQVKKAFFAVALLVSMTSANAYNGRSFFLGANVGNIAGGGLHEQAGRTHLFDNDKIYGSFNAHMEYNSSFNANRLGEYLSPIANDTFRLGNADNTGGTAATDVFGAFFLLNESYTADITFKPKSSTFTSNLNLFVGLDEWVEGLWLDFNLPIVHNKRNVKITETQVTAAANANVATGFFENADVTPAAYTSFTAAMVGDKGCDTGPVVGNHNFGKINGSRSTTKVGNFTAVLGYDVMNKENMHLGVGLLGLVNGNGKSDAVYMFEPSVGTGGRHGIGGRVNGHVRMYEKDDMEFSLYLNADVVHLFDATVKRTYDVTAHGNWSRYMLYKEWLTANLNDAGAPVTNGLTHGVNFTTLQAKVGMDVMYNVDLVLGYTNGSLGVNVGYGLFGHSKEEHKSWVDSFTTKNYAAWVQTVADMDAAVDHLYGTNMKIDGGNGSSVTATTATATTATVLTRDSLDKNSAMNPSAMVHRVHGDVNYRWEDNEWAPHVGMGAGAEFGSNNAALRQWGVHAHLGICF